MSTGVWILGIGFTVVSLLAVVLYLLIDHGHKLALIMHDRHEAQDQRMMIESIVSQMKGEFRAGNAELMEKIEGERQQYGVLEQKAVSHLLALTIAVNEMKAKFARFFVASGSAPSDDSPPLESKRSGSRDTGK